MNSRFFSVLVVCFVFTLIINNAQAREAVATNGGNDPHYDLGQLVVDSVECADKGMRTLVNGALDHTLSGYSEEVDVQMGHVVCLSRYSGEKLHTGWASVQIRSMITEERINDMGETTREMISVIYSSAYCVISEIYLPYDENDSPEIASAKRTWSMIDAVRCAIRTAQIEYRERNRATGFHWAQYQPTTITHEEGVTHMRFNGRETYGNWTGGGYKHSEVSFDGEATLKMNKMEERSSISGEIQHESEFFPFAEVTMIVLQEQKGQDERETSSIRGYSCLDPGYNERGTGHRGTVFLWSLKDEAARRALFEALCMRALHEALIPGGDK